MFTGRSVLSSLAIAMTLATGLLTSTPGRAETLRQCVMRTSQQALTADTHSERQLVHIPGPPVRTWIVEAEPDHISISDDVWQEDHKNARDTDTELLLAEAEVDAKGVLSLSIRTRTPDGKSFPEFSGREAFDLIWKHFEIQGRKINAIKGTWIYAQGWNGNLDTFNKATAGQNPRSPDFKQKLKDAAFATFTGKMAKAHGFTEVTVPKPDGRPGKYGDVVVTFRRP